MSVVAAGAGLISDTLTPADVSIAFFSFIILALACAMIGLELLKRLHENGLSGIGKLGLILLVIFVPIIFVFLVGKALLSEWVLTWSSVSIPVVNVGGAFITCAILIAIFYLIYKDII